MFMQRFSASLLVVGVLCGTAARTAQAREVTWTGGTDDFWDENLSWIDDQNPPQNLQPFVGDNAIIPAGGTPITRFLEQISNLTNAGTIQANSTLEMRGNSIANSGVINIGDGSEIISQVLFSNPFLPINSIPCSPAAARSCCARAPAQAELPQDFSAAISSTIR